MKLRHNNRGDTIVEVLVAIAVIALVLGGAYASSTRSLNANRNSQEHLEATKLVESQLEQLKVAAANPASPVFTLSSFCMNLAAGGAVARTGPNPFCEQTIGGATYDLEITRPTNGDNNTYTAQARWAGAGSGNQQSVKLIYKVRR